MKSIRRSLLARQPAAVRSAVRSGRAWMRGHGEQERMLPTFLILGGQRCGTTSLYRYLAEHPDVHPGLVKEIQFFTLNFDKGLDWYRSQFPSQSAGGQTFDASPYYLFHPAAPERAARVLPDAGLVALVRNPVDRAFSHYQHNVGRGIEQLSFEEALEAEPDRLAGEEERLRFESSYSSPAHRRYSYAARGEYASQLERWLEHYGRDRLLVLVSEEFFADPASTFRSVLDFLGLPSFDLERYEAFTRRKPWKGPPLSPGTRAQLQERFAEANRGLERMLGRDLPWA